MNDHNQVMSWLEGLAEEDWREFYSDSEVMETAKAALDLLKAQQETIDELISADKALKEIVRCKDCKYNCAWKEKDPNWFCADGVKKMIDIKTLVDDLHNCRRYLEDKEWSDNIAGQYINTINDAIIQLKKQQAVEPEIHMEYMSVRKDPELTFFCGACGGEMIHKYSDYPVDVVKERYKYCHHCGRKVLWK